MKNSILLFIISWLIFTTSFAQQASKTDNLLLINASYSLQLPLADLKARFGQNLAAGIGAEYIISKNNLILGVHTDVLFGTKVKEDVLASLRNDELNIIASDRGVSDILLRQRGLHIRGQVGKIFPISQRNRQSGIRLSLGAGLLQHKVRIQDEPQRFVPQLDDTYKKGYDRLTNGLAISQFVGYQFRSLDGRINLHLGLELVEAFTKNRRSFNFDTMMHDDTERLDMLLGFKLNWSLPLYFQASGEEIIY